MCPDPIDPRRPPPPPQELASPSPEQPLPGEDPAASEAPPQVVRYRPPWLIAMRYWAGSALLHTGVLLSLWCLISHVEESPSPRQPLSIALERRVRPRLSEKHPEPRRPVQIPVATPKPPVLRRAAKSLAEDIPRRTDESLLSRTALEDLSLPVVVGTAGRLSGTYAQRFAKGSLLREGGSPRTERAVRGALEWLARHQEDDGRWQASRHMSYVSSESKNFDIGVTSLALLAFTGSGQTHRNDVDTRFRETVDRALRWLLSTQTLSDDPRTHGRFLLSPHRKFLYGQSIATMAVNELLLLSGDVFRLKRPARAAAEYCLASRTSGAGWRYEFQHDENDTSVTGWMVLALKVARRSGAGVDHDRVERAIADSVRYMESLTDERGETGYSRRGVRHGSSLNPCMTSVAVLCRLFAGVERDDPLLAKGVALMSRNPPRWRDDRADSVDLYYWYYGSYAQFQYGGKAWQSWNEKLLEALLPHQRRGDDAVRGSWDPIGVSGRRAGRVYSTAIAAMTLEVYYRYARSLDGIGF